MAENDDLRMIRRGTTAPVAVEIEGCDLSLLNIHLTFAAGSLVTKTTEDGELVVNVDTEGGEPVTTVTASLTQDDTLSFVAGVIGEVQVRAYKSDGSEALATSVGRFKVGKILEDGKLEGIW